MHRTMHRTWIALVLGIATATACDESMGLSGLDEVDEGLVPGTYRGNHVFRGAFRSHFLDDPIFSIACNGEVVITSAHEGRIDGTVTFASEIEDCQPLAGSNSFTGTLSSNGSLRIRVAGLKEFSTRLEEFIDDLQPVTCTMAGDPSFDPSFDGTLRHERIHAVLNHPLCIFDCHPGDPCYIAWDEWGDVARVDWIVDLTKVP